ncbi:PEP-CTERM sorting domain-containing protein [Desulfurivibrio sp. D14AmB]|uniref:PEP-CTERM sorting domain-containing protein n=1 Tax=Desulfurivibrio sp. D14AmB TaxID=3374370 RepID=UPI00376EB09A
MKKKIAALAMSALFGCLVVGTASAALITDNYQDTWYTFPGWDVFPNQDEIGSSPQVTSMSVTYDNVTNQLDSVAIYMSNRTLFDSLFINTDTSTGFEAWDYMARQQTGANGSHQSTYEGYYSDHGIDGVGQALYTVADDYSYTYADGGRIGHPNGIEWGDLTLVADSGSFMSWTWTNEATNTGFLTYDLSSFDIILGTSYAIAYAPWCANDVIGVPEPGTLLLFGAGLAGLVGVARRRVQVA